MLLTLQSCVQVLMTWAPLNIFPAEDGGKVAGGGSCTLWDSFWEGWGLVRSSVLLESLFQLEGDEHSLSLGTNTLSLSPVVSDQAGPFLWMFVFLQSILI